MTNDDAGRLADDSLRDFIATMAAAGNPGSGRHEIGMHHVQGWILEYDGTLGGAEIQSVIGTDGTVHARREPRSLRTRNYSGSQWVLRDPDALDPHAEASAFVAHLDRLLAFDGVGSDQPDDGLPRWGSVPERDSSRAIETE